MQSIIWFPDIWMLDMGRWTHLDGAVFARIMVGGSRGPETEKDQG